MPHEAPRRPRQDMRKSGEAPTHAREAHHDRKTLAKEEHAFTVLLASKVQNWRVSRESVEGKSATLSAIVLAASNRGWTVDQTATFVGVSELDVRNALTRGLKAIAKVETLEASAYRHKVGGRLESIDAQLQALADAAIAQGQIDVATRALEARRKTAGDLATLFGANASRHEDDSADAIAELLSRAGTDLSEADRTANEPALSLTRED